MTSPSRLVGSSCPDLAATNPGAACARSTSSDLPNFPFLFRFCSCSSSSCPRSPPFVPLFIYLFFHSFIHFPFTFYTTMNSSLLLSSLLRDIERAGGSRPASLFLFFWNHNTNHFFIIFVYLSHIGVNSSRIITTIIVIYQFHNDDTVWFYYRRLFRVGGGSLMCLLNVLNFTSHTILVDFKLL